VAVAALVLHVSAVAAAFVNVAAAVKFKQISINSLFYYYFLS
jgi:hypothetical protein